MAYGVIIRASAATAEGTHTVEILRDGYSGAVHEVHAGGPVFYTEEYGQRGGDLDADIRPSQVTANFVITDAAALGAVRGTLSAESREYRMVVRHGAAVMWQGYVMPVTSVTRLDDGPATVRVVAKDRVRSLDDQTFAGAGGAPYTGQAALSTILERELGYAGHSITQHEYAARFRPAGVSDPYAQVRIDQARFYDDETGEPTHSRGDVVRAILGTQQAQLTQWRGRWEVTTPHAAGDTYAVDRWVARSDELSGEPAARQGRASYDVGGTAVALQNGSFEAGPIGGSPTAPGWTGMARRQVPLSAVEGQYVGVRDTVITEGPITPEQARSMASSYGYQRVPIVVGTGAFTVQVSAGGRIIQSGSGPGIRTDRHTLYLFAHIRHTGGYYYNDEAGQWQSAAHKIYLGSTFTSGLDAFWIGETIEVPTVPEGGEVEIALYSGVLATGDGWQSGWTAETWYDAVELMPSSATGREVISFTSYSPAVQDGETESVEVPIGDGPFESARGAMRLASGALTSEWRVGSESRTVPHTQILAEHLMRTRGKGRRRVRLTTTGPVSEMAPVKKMQLDSISYWPVYMSIEWPRGQATIEGIELIDVPVPSGMRETVEVRPAGPSAQAGAHRVYDYVQDQGYVTPEAGDARYLRQTGGTLTGDLVFSGGGRLRGKDDALHVYDEAGTNHGVLTVGVLRVLDHVDSYQTDILEVEDQYIKVNRGQPYPDLNGGLIVERGAVDSYLEFDEGRERWGWRMGADLSDGTFRAFVDEARQISAGVGLTGGGSLSEDRTLSLTGQALALHHMDGAGLFTRTPAGGILARSIATTGSGLSVANGDGSGGNPTLGLSDRLQGVHGAANGLLVGTSNGAASRTIQGTANQVLVANGNGIGGNPVLSLPQDIHTGATPEFAGLTITNANRLHFGVYGDARMDADAPSIWASRSIAGGFSPGQHGHLVLEGRASDDRHIYFLTGANSDARMIIHGDGNVSLSKQATSGSHALRADRTLRIQGTANRISVSNDSALNLTSDRAWQITAPQDLHTDSDFLVKTLRTKDWAGSTSFASGWTGHGWRAEDDHLEVTDLTVRNRLRVYELLIEQIRANNGSVAISNAAEVASVSGSTITLDEGVPVPFVVGDILRAQRFTGEGVYVSMIRVTSVGSGSFGFTLLEGDAPAEGMEYVRVGNVSDLDRQGLVYLTASDSGAPFIDIIDGIDDHTKWNSSDVVRSRFGRLDGLTVSGFGQLDGYGAYIQRGYIDKEVIIGGAGLSIDSFQQRPTGLWHFDGSLVDTISGVTPVGYADAAITDYGLVTGDGLVATLRRDGKFGGGVAVEEGTTNLIPINRQKFEGWSTYSGAQVTVTQRPDGRTHIQTSGGDSAVKYYLNVFDSPGITLTSQIQIENIGSRVLLVVTAPGVSVDIQPGERKSVVQSGTTDANGRLQLQFRAPSVSDDLDFIAWHPQVEEKPFATSFTEGTRGHGRLSLPTPPPQQGTVATWVRVNQALDTITDHASSPRIVQLGRYATGAGNSNLNLWIYHQGGNPPRLLLFASGDGSDGWSPNASGVLMMDAADTEAAFFSGEPAHVAVTWENHDTIKVYVNGSQVGTTRVLGDPFGSEWGEANELRLGDSGSPSSQPNSTYSNLATFDYALSPAEIRRIALSDAPIQERPSQVRITGEQILVGTDTLIRDGFIQSKYIAANSLTAEQLNFTPLLSANGTGDIIATINATSEELRIAANKIRIDGTTTFSSGYDPSEKETPTGAQTKADAARDAAIDEAGHLVDGLADSLGDFAFADSLMAAMEGETIIQGGYLQSILIKADDIRTGILADVDSKNYINLDTGAGQLAGGNIVWNAAGEVTFGSGVSLSWSQVDSRPTSLSDLDSSAASTLSSASSTASNALSAANDAQSDATAAGNLASTANNLANQINTRTAKIHETYIDATEIRSPTIAGNQGVFTGYVSAGGTRIGANVESGWNGFRVDQHNYILREVAGTNSRWRLGSADHYVAYDPGTYLTIETPSLKLNSLTRQAMFAGTVYAESGTFEGTIIADALEANAGTIGGMTIGEHGLGSGVLSIDAAQGYVTVNNNFALGNYQLDRNEGPVSYTSTGLNIPEITSYEYVNPVTDTRGFTRIFGAGSDGNQGERRITVKFSKLGAASDIRYGAESSISITFSFRTTTNPSSEISSVTVSGGFGGIDTIVNTPAGTNHIYAQTRARARAAEHPDFGDMPSSSGMTLDTLRLEAATEGMGFVGRYGARWEAYSDSSQPVGVRIDGLRGNVFSKNGIVFTDTAMGGINAVGSVAEGDFGDARYVYRLHADENGQVMIQRYDRATQQRHYRHVTMQHGIWQSG